MGCGGSKKAAAEAPKTPVIERKDEQTDHKPTETPVATPTIEATKEENVPDKDGVGAKTKKPSKKGGKKRTVKKKGKTGATDTLGVAPVSEFGESYFASEKPGEND